MKRHIFIALFLSFTFVLVACSVKDKNYELNNTKDIVPKINGQATQNSSLESDNKNSESNYKNDLSDMAYKISKASYIDKDIIINYPQLIHLNDTKKYTEVNELIKNEALEVLGEYKGVENEFSLEIDYNVKWKSSNLLSIQYLGISYIRGAAHPNNLVYTININLNSSDILKLRDIIKINDSFVERYKKGKYITWDPDLNLEAEGVIKNILDNYTNRDLIQYFSKDESFYYFTKDSLGISIGAAHVYGDHAEFEIKYQDMIYNINDKSEIWKDFSDYL
ncbi:MAG TPA: hypothetical protein DHV55_18545 [Clostridiaceae bacterium]|nr:hypothetical protein [Clostridiaceae bacterium]